MPALLPVVEPGVDRDRDTGERGRDEEPAQRVEVCTSGMIAPCVSASTSCASSTPAAPMVATPAAPLPISVLLWASTSRADHHTGRRRVTGRTSKA